MLVESLKHGRLVLKRFASFPWFAFDTETKGVKPFAATDALIWGRGRILVWSICHKGESYSFPTGLFHPSFPSMQQWLKELNPLMEDKGIRKVGHNAKYDMHVVETEDGVPWANVWDSMVACWMANESVEKGLKKRAPLYGRHLRETSTVSFTDKQELATYAEEDVIQTDELYQMQRFGAVERPKKLLHLNASGVLVQTRNPLPHGTIVVDKEDLSRFERDFLFLQEFPILRATFRAESQGFPFDVNRAERIRLKLEADRIAAEKQIFQATGEVFNLNAPKQVGKALSRLGVHSVMQTKKGGESYSYAALHAIKDHHPIVSQIITHRKITKLQAVYIGRPDADGNNVEDNMGLEYFVHPRTKRIHCTMNTVGAITGRFSVQLPNLTQIPSRADTYGIKDCFIPPRGQLLICLDYSQLEIRVMALMSKDKAMRKILNDPKGDIHQITADYFKVDRNPTAKILNFLMLYGGGSYMLSQNLTLNDVPTTPETAEQFLQGYDTALYPGVREYRLKLCREHQKNGFVRYLTGRTRSLPDINWEDRRSAHKAETTLSNNIIQGSGQDLLKASIVRCDPRCINPDRETLSRLYIIDRSHAALLKDYAAKLERIRRGFRLARVRWILQIHDEAIYFADRFAALDIGHQIADIMSWRHYLPATTDYTIPIVVEGGIGETWKHAKSKEALHKITAGHFSPAPSTRLRIVV